MIFTEADIIKQPDRFYTGKILKDYESNNVIKYGLNRNLGFIAWYVLNTDLLFNFNSFTGELGIYLSYAEHHKRFSKCFGAAILNSECHKDNFLPFLEILSEYKFI